MPEVTPLLPGVVTPTVIPVGEPTNESAMPVDPAVLAVKVMVGLV